MAFITFRPATALDAPDLLQWKNDPVTRKFSIATHDEITESQHAAWMTAMLADPNRRTYIIEYDGHPCGDVRIEVHAEHVEIAVKLDQHFRGRGIGSKAIRTVGNIVQQEMKKRLIAKIVYGNVASMRLFESCGYRVYSHGEGYYICSKDYIPTSE